MLSRKSDQYKAALELELWKDITEQEVFTVHQKREEKLLSECSSSFLQEQARMESEVRLSKKGCDQISKNYKERLIAFEKREKKMKQNVVTFERNVTMFHSERSAKLEDTQRKSKCKADFLNLEYETLLSKVESAGFTNKRLKHKLDTATVSLETEHSVVLSSLGSIPAALQDELVKTKLDYEKAKQMLAKLSTGKERYRCKLRSVLQELGSAKSRKQNNAGIYSVGSCSIYSGAPPTSLQCSTNIKQSSSENKNAVHFEELKTEISDIIRGMHAKIDENLTRVPTVDIDTDITQLISDRNILLNTGVYESNDFVIQQIDEKIKKLLRTKRSSDDGR